MILFPDLFPGLVFATPLFQIGIGQSGPGQKPSHKKTGCLIHAPGGQALGTPSPVRFRGTRTEVSSGLGFERLKLPDPPPLTRAVKSTPLGKPLKQADSAVRITRTQTPPGVPFDFWHGSTML